MVGDSAGEIYEWDGKSWSPPTTVDPRNDLPFVVGLSCPTTKECVAATFDGYAYTWDGASWSLVASPVPPGAAGSGSP